MDLEKKWGMMSPSLDDLEVFARLLERAGILIGVDPEHGPDGASIQHGIGRLGNMLRDAEGRNRTLQRQLSHSQHGLREMQERMTQFQEQRDALQEKYDRAMKYSCEQADALALKTGELYAAKRDLAKLRKKLRSR